jgi:hypothetical protein
MPDLWPEDLLTEAEREASWFDRQVIQGRLRPEDRDRYPRFAGGSSEAS